MEMVRTHRTGRDGLCRIRIRAGLARQKAARCCEAQDWRGEPRPMGPLVISIRWLLRGMDARSGSTASRQSLRIVYLEKRKERAIQATQEGPVFQWRGGGRGGRFTR